VEHIAGRKIVDIDLRETRLGDDRPDSDCRRAATFTMKLDNGGLAAAVCNYLNAVQERCWGYEILRVFGTDGIVECDALEGTARLLKDGKVTPIEPATPTRDYFDLFAQSLVEGTPMPLTLEEELSATRWAVRAKAAGAVPGI
jgi:hypothetical protein